MSFYQHVRKQPNLHAFISSYTDGDIKENIICIIR